MAWFDRYLLRQLVGYFGFFALVLVLLFWVNRSVSLLNRAISNGQSLGVFFEFAILILPEVMVIVLPVAGVIATIFATNRMVSESEMVAAQAAGFGPFRLARPVFYFGLLVAAFMLILTHVLAPKAKIAFSQRNAEIMQNVTARFLSEGTFVHPARGVTLYIREITLDGELRDIFIDDTRIEGSRRTYTANKALIVNTEAGPRLVMLDGQVQIANTEAQTLMTSDFDDFAYDISSLIPSVNAVTRNVSQMPTPVLFAREPAALEEARASAAAFLFAAHNRSSQATLALTTILAGFATLLLGGFSRFGLWRQILAAVIVVAGVKVVDGALADLASKSEARVWLTYAGTLVGLIMTFALLWLSARPAAFTARGRARFLRREART